MSQDHLGLFDTPPDRRQIHLSLAIVGVLVVAFVLIVPVHNLRLREVEAFIPTVDAIMFLGELITATLLYAQAAVFRSRALTVLATCYLYTALLLVPHALTFPGAFAPDGLLGAGVNTTSWIAQFRRWAFPIATIAYVQLKRADSAPPPPGSDRPAARIGVWVCAAIAMAALATMLATIGHDLLPPLNSNHSDAIHSYLDWIELINLVLLLVATILLFQSCSSVLDIWLLVAFAGWLIQSLLVFLVQRRFTAGFYWFYAVMLFSHLVVMLALIAESNRLYARLAISASAWNREREARLLSMDALAATISHEVGQPLSAVSIHASVGLNWLTRDQPHIERAIKSLRDAIDAGQRTTDVVRSIRAMFGRRPGERTEFSLNDLVRETASLLTRELDGENVSLQLELDGALPPVLADRIQLQRVLVNLLTNAIEALSATRGRARRIAIRSAPLNGHDVLLEISDNGIGIAPEEMGQIFDAFFTTKATGAGLGLSLCRTIVDAHGGRLWASHGQDHGATFHLQMPSGGAP